MTCTFCKLSNKFDLNQAIRVSHKCYIKILSIICERVYLVTSKRIQN